MILRKVKLNKEQLQQIADILSNTGIVVVAATTIPSLLVKFHLDTFLLGGIISSMFWYLSIKVLQSWKQ